MNVPTRETDPTFADVICADPQWVREEFDALMSACFGEPPVPPLPAPPRVPSRPGHPSPPPGRPAPGLGAATFPAVGPARGRQRSPPASPPGYRTTVPAGT
jgi:hypothetical protein